MSHKYRELIGAQGKNMEILKAFLHALEDAGGDESTLNGYISDPDLQDDLARQIVGGPWNLVDSPKVVDVDWEIPFAFFCEKAARVKTVNLTEQGYLQPRVSIFKTNFLEFVPKDSDTALSYKLVPLPLRMNYTELMEWITRNAPVLATDRELIAYANEHVHCRCEIMALGSQTEKECFPRFTMYRGDTVGSLGWWGIDSKDENRAALGGTLFVLVRCAE